MIILVNMSKNYRVIISAEITVKADSKEEAEEKAKEIYLEDENPTENILDFDAILDDIQDKE